MLTYICSTQMVMFVSFKYLLFFNPFFDLFEISAANLVRPSLPMMTPKWHFGPDPPFLPGLSADIWMFPITYRNSYYLLKYTMYYFLVIKLKSSINRATIPYVF